MPSICARRRKQPPPGRPRFSRSSPRPHHAITSARLAPPRSQSNHPNEVPIVPRRCLATAAAIAVVTALAAVAPATAAPVKEPTLEGRALLAPDASAPAPFAGAPNTDPAPAPGSRQPVGGFSALIDAGGKDAFWAMADNGFGSKANSRSFLLRVYRLRAGFETARGGSGEVEIVDWITLRDPDEKTGWSTCSTCATRR